MKNLWLYLVILASFVPLKSEAMFEIRYGSFLELMNGSFFQFSATSTDTEVSYDSDALALFSSMTVEPDSTRKGLINTVITDLKSANIWDKLDVLYIVSAHDQQAARLNWKGNSSYNLTETNYPSFVVDRGYQTLGIDDYISWNWSPSSGVNFTQNDASVGVWTRNTNQYSFSPLGTGTAVDIAINPRSTSNNFGYRINSSSSNSSSNSDGSGFFSVSRSGSSATQGYINGSAAGSAGTTVSATLSASEVNFGRANNTFSLGAFSAAFAGSNLSGSEHLTLYNTLNTYLTAVGGNVTGGAASSTLTMSSAIVAPDGALSSDTGKGWTTTGLTRDPSDGTWWVGNHGKAVSSDPTFDSSVVHVSSDFSTILGEIAMSSVATTSIGSVQGVAYDTSDDTLWVIHKDPGVDARAYNLSKAGALLASFTLAVGTNGIAYDSSRDEIVISNDDGTVEWRNKTTMQLTGSTPSLTVPSVDHISWDDVSDSLLTTQARGSHGLVRIYEDGNVLTDVITLIDANQIEGVYWYGDDLYVANDAYFHPTTPMFNRFLIYPK